MIALANEIKKVFYLFDEIKIRQKIKIDVHRKMKVALFCSVCLGSKSIQHL